MLASGRLSLTAASRDMRRVPSLTRAVGCRIAADRSRVTLLVLRTQSRQLLQDIAATQAIAVVFSLPSTNLTFQIKGNDATETALQEGDIAECEQHREGFAREILPLGYSLELGRAVNHFQADDVVGITFTISDIFEQTPGPGAGSRMENPE